MPMVRNLLRAAGFLACCAAVGYALMGGDAVAQHPGLTWVTRPTPLICGSTSSFSATEISCGGQLTDYSAVLVEADNSATAVYICGNNAGSDGGPSRSEAANACSRRCTNSATCPAGVTFAIDVKKSGGGKCWSAASADAGVAVRVHCLR